MKADWRVTAIGMLMVSACSHQLRGPRRLSEATYEATRKAVDALEAANRERDAAQSVYTSKYQLAQQAVEQEAAAMGNESSDAWATNQVRTCLDNLKEYRDSFDSRDTDNEAIAQQLKGLRGKQMTDANGVLSRKAATLDQCMAAARGYL